MILYNICKNGPYVYDKFILNIGQIINDVRLEEKRYKETVGNASDKIADIDKAYADIQKQLNDIQTILRSYLY